MKTKTFFSSMLKSSLMLLAAVTISFAMTACSDDDDKGGTVSPYKQWLLTGENNFLDNGNIAAMVLDATNPTTMAVMVKPSATFVDLDPDLFYLESYIPYSITLNADGTSGTINIEDVQCPFKNLTANSVDVTLPGSESKTVHATVPSSKIEVSKGSFSTTDGTRRIIKSCAFYHDDDDEYYNIVLSDAEGTITPGKKPSGKWLAINILDPLADGKKYNIPADLSSYTDFTIYEDGASYDDDDFASGTIRVEVLDTEAYGYFVYFRFDGTLKNGKKISVKAYAEASKVASYIWPVLR
jgi:hypothetical protein